MPGGSPDLGLRKSPFVPTPLPGSLTMPRGRGGRTGCVRRVISRKRGRAQGQTCAANWTPRGACGKGGHGQRTSRSARPPAAGDGARGAAQGGAACQSPAAQGPEPGPHAGGWRIGGGGSPVPRRRTGTGRAGSRGPRSGARAGPAGQIRPARRAGSGRGS